MSLIIMPKKTKPLGIYRIKYVQDLYAGKHKIVVKEIKEDFLKYGKTYHFYALEDSVYKIHPN